MYHLQTTLRAAVLLALLAPGLAASTARGADDVATLRFTVRFNSIATTLHTLPGGHTYGWNHFTGTTRLTGQDADVDFLGAVNYVDGSGRFEGFITLTRADGAVLAFRIEGDALVSSTPQGPNTDFGGRLEVIQGTDEFEGATGIGVATGYRRGALGSPVTLSFLLTLIRN